MLIGYMRVSKADGSQTTDLQLDALIQAGVKREMIYEDYASGKKDDRPGLVTCLKALRPNDVLIIWKLDRLARDLRHLVNIAHDLKERGIGLKVLTGFGANIDTGTPNGRAHFHFLAGFTELERDQIVERTIAGLNSARARGRIGGRKRKMTVKVLKYMAYMMSQPKTIVSELCEELKISRQTLYRYVAPGGKLRPEGETLLKEKAKIL